MATKGSVSSQSELVQTWCGGVDRSAIVGLLVVLNDLLQLCPALVGLVLVDAVEMCIRDRASPFGRGVTVGDGEGEPAFRHDPSRENGIP